MVIVGTIFFCELISWKGAHKNLLGVEIFKIEIKNLRPLLC